MNKKKKKITQIDIWKGIRKFWNTNPITKVIPNKKKRSRAKIKQDFKKEIKDG